MSRFDTPVADPDPKLRGGNRFARARRRHGSCAPASPMRYLTTGLTLLIMAVACDSGTGPVVLRGDFTLVSLAGKLLPLPDGDGILIGDSLSFDETQSQPRILATVVHRRPDGSLESLRGYQWYDRRGDTVTTSFACRFGELCLALVAAPETGILRNDSLIFSPKSPTGPTRIYRRSH